MADPLALIVEDDVDTAEFFAQVLTAANFETDIAYDSKTARQRLDDSTPVLVLLDLYLPDGSGWDIVRFIRSDDRLKEARIIIATGEGSATQGQTAELVDIVLHKPVDFDQLHLLASRLRESAE